MPAGRGMKPVPLAWPQDVRDAFEGGREGFEIGAGAEAAHAFEAGFEIDEIAPADARGHAGIDFVVGEAADVLEVVAHAFGEEGAEGFVVADEIEKGKVEAGLR